MGRGWSPSARRAWLLPLATLVVALTLSLQLSGASGATVSDAIGIATILDDDVPTVSIDDVTLAPEGAAGTTQLATFTISLSTASAQTVTVRYSTTNGTAVAPADYTAVALTAVTFAPGETTKQVTVTVIGDALDEVDETFQVQLSQPPAGTAMNATILKGTGVATIPDDDPLPALSVADATVVEGTGGSRNLVFTITLTPVSGRAVTVNYATSDGTAVSTGASPDYTPKNGQLSFFPGVTSLIVSVQLTTDSSDELDETLYLDLTLPADSPATISDAQAVGTIDDDDGPTITISDPGSIAEGAAGTTTPATFTISLSAPSVDVVTVRYQTTDRSATAPGDYVAVPATTVTLQPGEASKDVTVTINGDDLDEPDEALNVTFNTPTNAAFPGAASTVARSLTIIDDDAVPAARIEDASVKEGSVGNISVFVTVSLSNPSERTVSMNYATADGTATGGVDYGAISEPQTLSFAPGVTQRTIPILIGTDAAVENDETFTVTLSTPTNATIERDVATVTILDDDLTAGTMPSLSIADVSVPEEGDSGTQPVTLTVRLSNPAGRTLTVSYTTADDSAVAPADYAAVNGTLSFAPGDTVRTIETTIQGDEVVETNHSFKVNLADAVNATIADGSATVTIKDDDVGLGRVTVPTAVNASKVFCARSRGCRGLLVRWTVLTRGTLTFELTALAPRRRTKTRAAGTKVIRVLKTTSTISRAGRGRKALRPTPGVRARRMLRRLRSAKAEVLRVKVTFVNRNAGAESRTERVRLNLKR